MSQTKVERDLRATVKELKREVKDLEAQLSARDSRIDFVDGLQKRATRVRGASIRRRERRSGLREATAVAMASDWHVGEAVPPEKVAWRNAYSLEIARLRSERFFHGVTWLVENHRQAFAIEDIILWLGGDLITGYIHEELMETSEVSPIYGSRYARSLIVDGINLLLRDLDPAAINILCNHGNHGRTTRRPRAATGAENSFEHLMYLFLSDDFAAEPRVKVHVTTAEHLYFEVYGHQTRWMHGDGISYQGGIGGLLVPVNRALLRLESVHKTLTTTMGHFHQYQSLPNVTVNGSMIGYNPYAMSKALPFEEPQQGFYLLDSRRGKCMSTPIWVDSDAEPWRQSIPKRRRAA